MREINLIYVVGGRFSLLKPNEMTSNVSLPRKETWLDEFCRISKSEKLTIETYHSMRKYQVLLLYKYKI
jgi:hypothetical protein